MVTIARMPQLAAGGDDASIQSWLVSKGDAVAEGQPLAEIETEKAVVELESEVDGVFAGALAEAGDTVAVGVPVGVIAEEGESIDDAFASAEGEAEDSGDPANAVEPHTDVARWPAGSAPSVAGEAAVLSPETEGVSDAGGASEARRLGGGPGTSERVFASPIARKMAKEAGVDVAELQGTGPNRRIVRRDVEAYLAEQHEPARVETPRAGTSESEAAGPTAATRFSEPAGDYKDVPHTGMRRAIARRLTESKSTVPHFYLDADIRADALLTFRKEINEELETRVSVNDLIVRAVAVALTKVPAANMIWMPEATRQFTSVDIAVAVAVPTGLLTPVVRSVESKSISTLSSEIQDLTERSRNGKIKQQELEGGTFSVSNLGMYGTKRFSAILNPPHSGILAVGAAEKRPIVNKQDALEIATVMSVTLSADHRVIDGAIAAEWLAEFARIVETPMRILL